MKARHIIMTVGATLGTATMLVGSAQAGVRPDDRGGTMGVGAVHAIAVPDVVDRAVLRDARAVTDIVDRAVIRHEEATASRPDDRGTARGPGTLGSPSTLALAASDGDQWRAELIGTAGAFAAVLLGAAALLTVRHRGRVALR